MEKLKNVLNVLSIVIDGIKFVVEQIEKVKPTTKNDKLNVQK